MCGWGLESDAVGLETRREQCLLSIYLIVNENDAFTLAFVESSLHRIRQLADEFRRVFVDFQSVDHDVDILWLFFTFFFDIILDSYLFIIDNQAVKTLLKENVQMFLKRSAFRYNNRCEDINGFSCLLEYEIDHIAHLVAFHFLS